MSTITSPPKSGQKIAKVSNPTSVPTNRITKLPPVPTELHKNRGRLMGNPLTRVALSVIVGLAIWFTLPPANGLTETGVRFVAILTGTMIMWITVNTNWTTILFLALLVVGGIMAPNAVWSASLGNHIVMLVLVYTALTQVLDDTGVIDSLAAWFVSRPFVKGRPYAFMAMFFAANMFIGIFMHNLALFVVFMTLTARLCKALGVEKGHSLYIMLMLGNLWVNKIINGASPIAKTIPNIIIDLFESQLGITISYVHWLAVGIPFMIIMLGLIMLTIRIMNPDVTPLKNFDVDAFVAETPKLDRKGKIASAVLVAVIAVVLIPDLMMVMGVGTGVAGWFMRLGVSVPAMVGIAVMCMIKVKGEPVMDFAKTAKNIPVGMLLFVGAIMVIGAPINNEANGILVWLRNIFTPLVSGMPLWSVFAVLILAAVVLTQFLPNTAVAILYVNLGIVLFATSGIFEVTIPLMVSFAFVTAVAASLAVMTPSATIVSPFLFEGGHITMANSWKPNLLFTAFSTVVALAFIPVISWLVGIMF